MTIPTSDIDLDPEVLAATRWAQGRDAIIPGVFLDGRAITADEADNEAYRAFRRIRDEIWT